MDERKPIDLMVHTPLEASEQKAESLSTVVYRIPEIDDEIDDFMARHDFESYSITRKKDSAQIVGRKGSQVLTLNIVTTANGNCTTATDYQVPPKKSDLVNDIIELRRQKKTQAEIASILNISQSYVSTLVRQSMNNNEEEV